MGSSRALSVGPQQCIAMASHAVMCFLSATQRFGSVRTSDSGKGLDMDTFVRARPFPSNVPPECGELNECDIARQSLSTQDTRMESA